MLLPKTIYLNTKYGAPRRSLSVHYCLSVKVDLFQAKLFRHRVMFHNDEKCSQVMIFWAKKMPMFWVSYVVKTVFRQAWKYVILLISTFVFRQKYLFFSILRCVHLNTIHKRILFNLMFCISEGYIFAQPILLNV